MQGVLRRTRFTEPTVQRGSAGALAMKGLSTMKKLLSVALVLLPLGLAGCSHPQPVYAYPPPPAFSQVCGGDATPSSCTPPWASTTRVSAQGWWKLNAKPGSAPRGVKVLTMAPAEWGDLFFFALMQERDAAYADIRGRSTAQDAAGVGTASFTVPLDALRRGLAAIGLKAQYSLATDVAPKREILVASS